MSNLIPAQQLEITEIVQDAIAVTPTHHQRELIQAFSYLAECYISSRRQSHLADIQALINAAKADNTAALAKMQASLKGEISQLRRETQQGFMAVGEAMSSIADRVERLESDTSYRTRGRDSLRDSFAYRIQQPPSRYVHITNNSGNEDTPQWVWRVTVLIAITALLGLAQSLQIQNALMLELHQRQEVR